MWWKVDKFEISGEIQRVTATFIGYQISTVVREIGEDILILKASDFDAHVAPTPKLRLFPWPCN